MKAFKGFNKDMTCNGKQYAENTVFEEPEADLCRCGMHFCENPLDVLDYYNLVTDEGDLITAAEVEPLGEVKTDGKKSVTTKLRIGAKLSFPAFIKAGADFLIERTKTEVKEDEKRDHAQLAASGDYAQLAASGYYAKLAASGYQAQLAASGDYAKLAASGKNSVICCAGNGCVAKAKKGSWITLAEWKEVGDEWTPVCVKTEQVDGERIKEDTLYTLKNGEFVEVAG